MRKILSLLVVTIFLAIQAKAQTLISESFESVTFPPTGWQNVQVNGTGLWDRVNAGQFVTAATPHTGNGMARYNCYSYQPGTTAYLQSPSINLTTSGGNAKLRFWMYRDGSFMGYNDTVVAYINTASGLSGATKLGFICRHYQQTPVQAAPGWYEYTFSIPGTFTGTVNYILLHGISGFGTEMFVDDFQVFIPSPNDAGVASITAPPSIVIAGTQNVGVTVHNYGSATLTAASINWSVNGVLQTPYPWSGTLATGATSVSSTIGTYNFVSGIYNIKAWTTSPNGGTDGDHTNDTASKTISVQGFATLPFYESFDGTWVNKSSTRDVPNGYFNNTPATGNNSWRRDDDGVSAAWNSSIGAYTPAGANSSLHSARFHTYDSYNGYAGSLDIYANFTPPGMKTLKFWHNNISGYDTLTVSLSTDGGTTFSTLQKYAVSASWTQYSLTLGASVAPNCIVRFTVKSDFGMSDVGLDEVEILLPVANDAGIVSIESPQSPLIQGISNFSVKMTNFGTAVLNSATINWAVNGVTQSPFVWSGTLGSGGTSPAITIGSYNFATAGTYMLKSWTSNPNGGSDGYHGNDTTIKSVYTQDYATLPVTESFDGVWINKNDTNDVPSTYWKNTPAFGNNSWRRDDEGFTGDWAASTAGAYAPTGAGSTTHSARFHTYYSNVGVAGNLDLYCNFTPAGNKKTKFWYINPDGNDSLFVYLSTNNGNTYSLIGSYGVQTTWDEKQLMLGSSANAQTILRFKAKSDFGYSDIGLDEVRVTIQPANDMKTFAWTEPLGDCGMTNAENVSIFVTNQGSNNAIDVPVAYSINNGTTWVLDTIPGTIVPNDTVEFTFATHADFSAGGVYSCIGRTRLPADGDTTNDLFQQTVISYGDINTFPFNENFESGFTTYFKQTISSQSAIYISDTAGVGNSWGLLLTGGGYDGWATTGGETPTNAWVDYSTHHAQAASCNVDATSLSTLMLKVDLRQVYSYLPTYNWFRVLVNGTQISDLTATSDFNPITADSDPFATKYFDLTAYAGTTFTLTFQSSCKYGIGNIYGYDYDAVLLDNIALYSPQPLDVGASNIFHPVDGMCGLAADSVMVTVSNFGTLAASNIPVTAIISGPAGNTTLNGTIIGPLTPGNTINKFMGFVNTTASGNYQIKAFTSLSGDVVNNFNDTTLYNFTISPALSVPHVESFESATPTVNWGTDMYVYPAGSHGNTTAVLSTNLSSFTTSAYAIMNKKVGPISAGDYITFDYRIVNNDPGNSPTTLGTMDAIDLWLSADCGDNYNWLFTIDYTNHIPSTSPAQVSLPLTAYIGNEVIPLFMLTYGAGDYFVDIDNVKIGPLNSLNLGNDTTICDGSTLVLDAGGSAGYTYEWHEVSTPGIIGASQTFNVTQSGSYYVIVNDGLGHILTDAINVTVTAPVDFGNDTTVCANNSLLLQAGPGYTTFLWSTGATTQSIHADSTGVGLATGLYTVTASIGGSCISIDSIYVTWINCPGIPENQAGYEVYLYPNPTSGNFSVITGPSVGPAEISLYDMHGRLLQTGETNGRSHFTADISKLAAGVYTVQIRNSNLIKRLKLIKN